MVKGVVDKVFEKSGRFGTMYSIKLRNDPNYYGTKGFRPDVKPGQVVEFEANQNGRGYWDADGKSVRVKADEVAAAPTARATVGGLTKDGYWDRKEQRDVVNDQLRNIGAARNTAIAFVELLVKQEALKLPAKQADREKALLEAVEHYRKEFMSGIEEEPGEAPVAEETKPEAESDEEWS